MDTRPTFKSSDLNGSQDIDSTDSTLDTKQIKVKTASVLGEYIEAWIIANADYFGGLPVLNKIPAAYCGIPTGTFGHYRKGNAFPSRKNALNLESKTGLPIAELMNRFASRSVDLAGRPRVKDFDFNRLETFLINDPKPAKDISRKKSRSAIVARSNESARPIGALSSDLRLFHRDEVYKLLTQVSPHIHALVHENCESEIEQLVKMFGYSYDGSRKRLNDILNDIRALQNPEIRSKHLEDRDYLSFDK